MTDTGKQSNSYISDWLGDVVALESHVEEALDRQLQLKADDPSLSAAIQRFHDTVRDSKRRAQQYQEQYGSTAGNPIVKAGSNLLGKAAGMIDKIRNDSVSKAIRDDYTAFNHVAIAYTMLHTTAMALNDQQTQSFAEQGLRTYASLVQEVNHIIPEAVVHDLKQNEDAPTINPSVVQECRSTIASVWRSPSHSS